LFSASLIRHECTVRWLSASGPVSAVGNDVTPIPFVVSIETIGLAASSLSLQTPISFLFNIFSTLMPLTPEADRVRSQQRRADASYNAQQRSARTQRNHPTTVSSSLPWWVSLARKPPKPLVPPTWNRTCTFCGALLLSTEADTVCCNKGKFVLLCVLYIILRMKHAFAIVVRTSFLSHACHNKYPQAALLCNVKISSMVFFTWL